ncbi:MAG: hypothetical protein ACOC8D_00085 [bacterium]
MDVLGYGTAWHVAGFLCVLAGTVALWHRRVLAAVYPLLRFCHQSYSLPRALADLIVHGGHGSRFWSVKGHLIAPASVLTSPTHWSRVGNIHALVSSVGVAVLLSGLALWLKQRKTDLLMVVSALNFALFALGTVLYYNFHYPVQRDWDMFAPGALYSVMLAASVWRRLPRRPLERTALILLPAVATITVFWLAQQTGLLGLAPPPAIRFAFEAAR